MKYKSRQQRKENQLVGGVQKRFSQTVVNLHGTPIKTTVIGVQGDHNTKQFPHAERHGNELLHQNF